MANFSFTGLQTGVSFQDTTESQPTSLSNVNPDLSVMTNRAISSGTPLNVSFSGLGTAVSAWLTGRRPASGMLYPRGITGK
jgi:tRNA A37 threonylcarbamoyltransferase TsaD